MSESAGERLRSAVLTVYELTPAEYELLDRAAALADTLERVNAELVDAPLTVPGSRGQDVANPLLTVQVRTSLALVRVLESLGLPDVEEETGESATTRRARHAANVRWLKEKRHG